MIQAAAPVLAESLGRETSAARWVGAARQRAGAGAAIAQPAWDTAKGPVEGRISQFSDRAGRRK
jgi:hypothetical protein